MRSSTVRRRLHHGDVGDRRNENFETSGLDGLDEPLLGNHGYDDKHSERAMTEEIWDDERKKEQLHWSLLFSNLIVQWAQWIANLVFGSGSFIARFLLLHSNTQKGSNQKLIVPTLSPLQEARLRNLQQRLGIPFDGSRLDHQMMDAQWLVKRASYMEFNDVLKSTRTQLERELSLEDISSVKDLPAYNLLRSCNRAMKMGRSSC
ncbi:hypothetical protein V6N13_136562 [Hibiscus sabdariffa]|uniref:Uncharacterized protein n=1 Tax=Hibiscus sabdariffa TaxID=183260 RepID=A0ABR2DPH4_9ROSI